MKVEEGEPRLDTILLSMGGNLEMFVFLPVEKKKWWGGVGHVVPIFEFSSEFL